MRGTVLLISHDPRLLETRSLVLAHAGYKAVSTDSLAEAKWMAFSEKLALIILCQSLETSAQRGFIEELRKEGLPTPILCLEVGPSHPEELLNLCKELISAPDVRPSVRVFVG